MRFLLLFVPALLISCCSCTSVVLRLYGMHPARQLSDEQIINYARELNIPDSLSFRISEKYLTNLKQIAADTSLTEAVKNHYQPLQVLYFDSLGKMNAFVVNCYVSSSRGNLQWNEMERFESFPAKHTVPLDSLFDFEKLSLYLVPLFGAPHQFMKGHKVLVFWNHFSGRQAKNLIEIVQKQISNYKGSVEVVYINTDNLYPD